MACGRRAAELARRALIERIRAWQARYDRDENDWGLFEGDIQNFSRAGLEIARAVKTELSGWTVIYFDEAALDLHPDGPRELFEYEIGPSTSSG